jgi:hypothetical protein
MFKRLTELFKGKPAPKPRPKLRQIDENNPRPHHYQFAHRFLPALFFGNPERFLTTMSGSNGLDFLRFQWKNLEQYIEAPLSSVGLDYQTRRLDDGTTLVIVTLPPPQKVTEAYYTASVYRPAEGQTAALTRYFTLEYGIDLIPDQPKRMVLGEWTRDPQHLNYGNHFASDVIAFFRLVCTKLDKSVGDDAHASFTPKA